MQAGGFHPVLDLAVVLTFGVAGFPRLDVGGGGDLRRNLNFEWIVHGFALGCARE
jgi:hypothetical protein